MKIFILHALLTVCLLISASARQVSAQTESPASIEQLKEQVTRLTTVNDEASTPAELREKTRNFLIEHRNRLRLALQSELDALRNYRQTMGNVLLPAEVKEITDAIGELEKSLQALADQTAQPSRTTSTNTPAQRSASTPPLSHSDCNPTELFHFCLGAPTHKATDRPLEFVLAWSEPKKPGVQKYFLQVSEDELFTVLVVDKDVDPDPNISGGEFTLKKTHNLKRGHTYHWRVRADFDDGTSAWAQNGVFSFTIGNNIFEALQARGFSLQKRLTGPGKGELAEFGFLNTIGEKTVWSTTFALSWRPNGSVNFGNTNLRPSWSIEGNLASDESESEDAWRFRVSGIFVTDFTDRPTKPTFESLYYKGSLKLEGDKDFDVRKLSGEFLITPSSFALAMGTARPGQPSKPIQFQWRPFFSLDAGHTFRRGNSEEREDTILRLVPRVRMRIDLQFIRQWLNMNEVAIFADDTFYYLPLENQRKRNNFFTSGIEFNFTPHLGIGLTYNNGRSAPKFQKINTLQGILGIRF